MEADSLGIFSHLSHRIISWRCIKKQPAGCWKLIKPVEGIYTAKLSPHPQLLLALGLLK
jgi:hypothetical protein